MSEAFLDGRVTLHCGDCLQVLKTLPDHSIDAVVTDPPYGIRFMGEAWDGADIDARWQADERSHAGRTVQPPAGRTAKPGLICSPSVAAGSYDLTPKGMIAFQQFTLEYARECLRVLKPGGHLASFSSTRTYHRMACAIEDAGFEVRDQLAWVYGTGFNKVGYIRDGDGRVVKEGWAGSLKPAHEPICLARKPLSEKTIAANVLRWGTGALNINGCRISAGERKADGSNGGNGRSHINARKTNIPSTERQGTSGHQPGARDHRSSSESEYGLQSPQPLGFRGDYRLSARSDDGPPHSNAEDDQASVRQPSDEPLPLDLDAIERDSREDPSTSADNTTPHIEQQLGRWPANLCHDGSQEVLDLFPESKSTGGSGPASKNWTGDGHTVGAWCKGATGGLGDSGSAARFFFQAKRDEPSASRMFYSAKADEDSRIGSSHPTVKPIDLMQWLCRLITPKNGTVLDCFAGTGTTGEAAWREGFSAILIERDAEHQADIRRRMDHVLASARERRQTIVVAKGRVDADAGPLFGAC